MMKQLSVVILFLQLFFLLFAFQNCSPGFKSNSQSSQDAVAPLGTLQITANNRDKFFAETGKSVLLIVQNGELELDPAKSSLTAIRGNCPANQTWAPLNQAHSPWTSLVTGGGANFLSGANTWNYSQTLDSQMGGCDWRGCVAAKRGAISCVEFQTRCQPQTLHPFNPTCVVSGSGAMGSNICNAAGNGFICSAQPPASCNAATKPVDQVQAGLACSSIMTGYTGTYSRTTPYICNMSNLMWILGTPVNNTSMCVAPPSNCNSATKPANTAEQKTCASLFNSTYSGNYMITHSYMCSGTMWVPAADTNDSATACVNRQCPPPQPMNTSQSFNCSAQNPMYSGTYQQTISYSCNTANYSWLPATSDNFSTACQTSIPKLSSLPRNANGDVTVAAGTQAFIDTNADISVLTINGTLICGGPGNYELKAKTIFVNGTFSCGSAANAYSGNLTISLKHDLATQPKTGVELAGQLAVPNAINYRALIVNNQGQLILHGNDRGTFARLNASVTGGNQITLIQVPPTWKVGDEIAIAPTSYEYDHGESFKITAIAANVVTLNGNVVHPHWGGGIDDYSGQVLYGPRTLDQRAEVVNLTRGIKIQADDPNNQLKFFEQDAELGGHVMVMNGGFAQVDGVEFYKMGQAGMMARYPFHWHFVGNAPGQYIKNSSIHTSFQRCVTVHATNQALVQNNICYQFRGHGYFLEDGNEIQNTIENNIGIGAYAPFAAKVLLSSDNLPDGVGKRFPAVATFWISNPQNKIRNNISAGSIGNGFWNSFEPIAVTSNTDEFNGNVAHSGLVGLTWDGAQTGPSAGNLNNPNDRKLTNAHYHPAVIPVFDRLVAYKNSQAGIYFRGNTVVYDHAFLADNDWSFFLAYNQIIKNTTLVGVSKNNGTATDSSILQNTEQVGITMYDGPFELYNVDFINFPQQSKVSAAGDDTTFVPIRGIGGSEKFTNITTALNFNPQPKYRVKLKKFVDNWADEYLSNSIRDRDGSLSGVPGGLVLGGEDFSHTPGCTSNSQFYFMSICPAATQMGIFRVLSSAYGGPTTVGLPQIWARSDGAVAMNPTDFARMLDPVTNLYAKTNVVASGGYSYEVALMDDFTNRNKNGDLIIQYYSEDNVNTLSPIVKLTGYGSNCVLNGASATASIADLNAASGAAYYSSGNNFYLRIRALSPHGIISLGQPNSGLAKNMVSGYSVSCSPLAQQITGVIDQVDSSGLVSGWACDYGSSAQIGIHLYVGGPAGSGTFVSAFTANLGSEAAVGFACGDGAMKGHRFSFRVPASVPASVYSGKTIYIHGINGRDNSLLYRSGQLSFP